MACATLIVVGLTSVAELLGPRLAGLLAPFPVSAGILAVFAHREAGAGAAVETLRGVIRGSISFALFFLIAGVGIEGFGTAGSLVAASASAVALHVILIDAYSARDVAAVIRVDAASATHAGLLARDVANSRAVSKQRSAGSDSADRPTDSSSESCLK